MTFFAAFPDSFEWLTSLGLLLFTLAIVAAYIIRSVLKGRAHFDRVNKQGSSMLLSKDMMEAAYWFFQPFGRALVFLRVTPNQISWASFVFGAIAGVCLAFGHFGSAAVFAAISAIFDSLDGLVARLTGTSSDAGEVLDAAVDRYAEFFFIGGLVVYYREIPALMILALFALIGSFMVSYSTAKAEALHVSPPKGSMRRPERAVYLTLGAALSPITIPMFEAYREYPIAIGHPMVLALCLVAVFSNISAIERLWAIAKAMRVREAEALRRSLIPTEAPATEEEETAPANTSASEIRR